MVLKAKTESMNVMFCDRVEVDSGGLFERQMRAVEGKIYSRTDIISDCRLQRSKHGSNCARSSGQQDMLALG